MKEQAGKPEQICPRAEIAAYVDGELSPAQELVLEQHLAACETCRTELNEQKKLLRALDFLLDEKPSEIEIPKNFAKVVATRAESDVSGLRNREERRRAVFLCASLGLIALVGLGAEAQRIFVLSGAIFEQIIAVAVFIGHLIYDIAFGVVVILRSLANQTVVSTALVIVFLLGFWLVARFAFARSSPVSHEKVIYTAALKNPSVFQLSFRQILAGLFCIFLFAVSICAQANISLVDENTLVVEDAPEMEIYSFGKKVIIKRAAKGVLAFGGDVIIEGRVEGDVATIGGSVYQKEGAFIGGDVITFGGAYRHDSAEPLRSAEKQTIVFAGYENELREMVQNPSQIFAPQFTWAFLAQRLLSVLFWFVVSLGLTTIAPGAVSRAVTRFQLSPAKIIGFGILSVIVSTILVVVCLKFLPGYLSTIVGLMISLILILAYVFGRVSLQVSAGKWLQRLIMPEKRHSESVALLLGVLFFTILLSLPYVWTLAVFLLWTASLGLVLTARATNNWQKI